MHHKYILMHKGIKIDDNLKDHRLKTGMGTIIMHFANQPTNVSPHVDYYKEIIVPCS